MMQNMVRSKEDGCKLKKYRNSICIGIVLCILLVSFSGCHMLNFLRGYHMQLNTPPGVKSVKELYSENQEDLETVILYLMNLGYEDIYITSIDGTMLADLVRVPIDNSVVASAVNRLLENDKFRYISKHGNTIHLPHWYGLQDIGCGIAYTINGIDRPEVQFATELTPITEDGWYYYVDDYNSWRSGERPG